MTIGTEATLAVAKLAQDHEATKYALETERQRLDAAQTNLRAAQRKVVALESSLATTRVLQDAQDKAFYATKDALEIERCRTYKLQETVRKDQELQMRTEGHLKSALKALDEEYRSGFGLSAPYFKVGYEASMNFAIHTCATHIRLTQPQQLNMLISDHELAILSDGRLAAKVDELVQKVTEQVRADATKALKGAREEANDRRRRIDYWSSRISPIPQPKPPAKDVWDPCPCKCGMLVNSVTGETKKASR